MNNCRSLQFINLFIQPCVSINMVSELLVASELIGIWHNEIKEIIQGFVND